MLTPKRSYNVTSRKAQSEQTKTQILLVAKKLFKKNGFDMVTIEAIANESGVAVPTIYAKFKSKRGILACIIDSALPTQKHDDLVNKIYTSNSAAEQFKLTAKLSRKLYEAEYQQMDWVRGAMIIDPIFKQLEAERESRRYERQKKALNLIYKQGALQKNAIKGKGKRSSLDLYW